MSRNRVQPVGPSVIRFVLVCVTEIQHDYKKLQHHLMYLQTTSFLPLILRADWKGTSLYIDGAHAVHADMKEHAGV